MITLFGKRFLTEAIAGTKSLNKKDLVLGIAKDSEYELANTNSRLGFEFYRLPVKYGGIDIDTSQSPTKYTAIFSATIPTDISGKINEVGLYTSERSSVNNFDNKFLTDFSLPYDWSPEPSLDQNNYRIGNSSLIFTSNGTSNQEYISTIEDLDISGYSNFDTLSFSYKVNNAYLYAIKVRLYSSDTDYYEFNFNNHVVGWNLKEKQFSSMSVVGSPTKARISKIGIVIDPTTSQASVSVDGIRINDEDTFDPSYGMIARSNVTELEKIEGRELLIEYKLDLNFG